MDKKRMLLLYLVILLVALPVVILLSKSKKDDRAGASADTVAMTIAPDQAQVNDQVVSHVWIISSAPIAFARVSLKFDNQNLKVISIANLTDKLQTAIVSTSVEAANNTGKIIFTKALSTENRNNPPTGAIDFVTITYQKKGETGTLTQKNVTFDKNDSQIVNSAGQALTLTSQGAKYQTSAGSVTNTPTPTPDGPTATVTSTKTPTPTGTQPGQIEVTGKLVKITCWKTFFCYQLTNTTDGKMYYLWSKPIASIMQANDRSWGEPIDPAITNAWRKAYSNICLDDVSDTPGCNPRIPGFNNFDQYVGKTVKVKGFASILQGKNILAITSVKVVGTTPTATKTPTPTAFYTPTPSLTSAPGADTTLDFFVGGVQRPINSQFTQDLTINTGSNQVTAVDLYLKYDPTLLSLNSLQTKSDVFPKTLQSLQIDNTTGVAHLVVGADTVVTGQKSFVTFAATGKKAGTGTLNFGPETKVSAFGNSLSVLKQTGKMDLIFTNNTLPGDIDLNGTVNIFDYNLLLQNFGNTTCGNEADITGPDNNGNCKVDIFDYNILLENFGKTSLSF